MSKLRPKAVSRFVPGGPGAGNLVTPAVLMVAVFLVSAIVIAFDSHDLACLKPKCSVCEVKKVYKATSKKALEDCVFISAAPWRDDERFHPASSSPSADRGGSLTFRLPRESDRAPPSLS